MEKLIATCKIKLILNISRLGWCRHDATKMNIC